MPSIQLWLDSLRLTRSEFWSAQFVVADLSPSFVFSVIGRGSVPPQLDPIQAAALRRAATKPFFNPHSACTGAVFTIFCAVVRYKANNSVVYMRSERGLSMLQHCLEWYKLVLRTCLPTPNTAGHLCTKYITSIYYIVYVSLRCTSDVLCELSNEV